MPDDKPYISEVIIDAEVLKTKPDEYLRAFPIRIEKHGNLEHKTETRIFAHELHEQFCDEPSCEFNGRHAAQGVCHTTEALHDWKNYERRYAHANEWLLEIKELCEHTKEDYVERLEGEFVTQVMNSDSTMDECIRLRAENAKLKLRVGEYK